jgi:hypothetical protein
MKTKLFCSLFRKLFGGEARTLFFCATMLASLLSIPPLADAGEAPSWMHALTSVAVPAHDEKTDAVELYSEDVLNVAPNGKIKNIRRRAFKVLRPGGKDYGLVRADFDSETKISGMHAWCIPSQGKDYEVKEKDAVESALLGIADGELMSDVRSKILQIPAADPGNIVGYEIEQEERPYVQQVEWVFQSTIPSREAHYTLQLPPDWEYKVSWMNYPETKPVAAGDRQWQWVINDIKAIKTEDDMPPWRAVAGQMLVSLFPPAGASQQRGFENWTEMGTWYTGLLRGRDDASPAVKQKVTALTAALPTPMEKMRAIAKFVQHDIRYVAIQLGIGGWQPHAADDVFNHRYGDCKDKATLMRSMLREIGVDSFHVVINTNRGAVTALMPAQQGVFNHAILAIQLPDSLKDPSLVATLQHPKLGRILFFDPTNELTPFGQLSGYLQENYGLLIGPSGGELLELPTLPATMTGIQRMAKLTLDAAGTLRGEVKEVRVGDEAHWQRQVLHGTSQKSEWIKPIESVLSHSFANFQVVKASMTNLDQNDLPFAYNYELVAENYGKSAGNLMLVRPRVLGTKSSGLLDTKEPRKYPVEFGGPSQDTDTFEITLPPGYVVDDLPPAANADYPFASYHSKTEVNGNVLRYTRSIEVKQLAVALDKVADLKRFYQIINGDERNTAVLRPAGPK